METIRYGYREKEGGGLEKCSVEQAVLTEIRSLRVAGLSRREIVDVLTAVGIVGRTGGRDE
jgi:hypothetical protein